MEAIEIQEEAAESLIQEEVKDEAPKEEIQIEQKKIVVVGGPAVEEAVQEPAPASEESTWKGRKLNRTLGTVKGPSGKETYYNLNMRGIVNNIKSHSWIWQEIAPENRANVSGDYYVRSDGCKMLGDYIMVAAHLDVHPRGSLVETTLGTGVVVDTGEFARTNRHQIDVAVNW